MNTAKSNFPESTPIQTIASSTANKLFIKRDDLYPLSFGGNKARKGRLFFEEILSGKHDHVVTYGSSSSNHCRVIANLASMNRIACTIISPEETMKDTFNKQMITLMGAKYIYCPVSEVAATIEKTMTSLREQGFNPYFIQGGGHGDIGTAAYVECYDEIRRYEEESGVHFDYIFFASGTGTTHAGLVCGQKKHNVKDQQIVGISIARPNPRGRQVVIDSVNSYLKETWANHENICFIDDYISGGYGAAQKDILDVSQRELILNGIPLDSTYTGKAFCGMEHYLAEHRISGRNVLFIHTGGTPLFYDDLEHMK